MQGGDGMGQERYQLDDVSFSKPNEMGRFYVAATFSLFNDRVYTDTIKEVYQIDPGKGIKLIEAYSTKNEQKKGGKGDASGGGGGGSGKGTYPMTGKDQPELGKSYKSYGTPKDARALFRDGETVDIGKLGKQTGETQRPSYMNPEQLKKAIYQNKAQMEYRDSSPSGSAQRYVAGTRPVYKSPGVVGRTSAPAPQAAKGAPAGATIH
jgi:hypothetical protein